MRLAERRWIVGQSGDSDVTQQAYGATDKEDSVRAGRDPFVSPQDDVVFVGPDGPVRQWPGRGERGTVESAGEDMVRVVWERSPLFVAWPLEWVKPSEAQLPDRE
jgi:hypothetical protein